MFEWRVWSTRQFNGKPCRACKYVVMIVVAYTSAGVENCLVHFAPAVCVGFRHANRTMMNKPQYVYVSWYAYTSQR